MKFRILLIVLSIACPFTGFAQSKWSFSTTAEESLYLTSDNLSNPLQFIGLNSLSANSGMGAGIVFDVSNSLDIEAKLSVLSTQQNGVFSTKLVPFEFIGHYNLLSQIDWNTKLKFNADIAIGSGLTSTKSNNSSVTNAYGFNEHLGLGASISAPLLGQSNLILGFRQTAFIKDIDANSNGLDYLSRFYAGLAIGLGKDIKAEKILADEMKKAEKLTASIKETQEENEALKNKISNLNTQHQRDIAALQDEIKALQSNQEQERKNTTKTELTLVSKKYSVIIGSYPSESSATQFISNLTLDAEIVYVDGLDTYRVVYSSHDSLAAARAALKEAKGIVETAWIAVY